MSFLAIVSYSGDCVGMIPDIDDVGRGILTYAPYADTSGTDDAPPYDVDMISGEQDGRAITHRQV